MQPKGSWGDARFILPIETQGTQSPLSFAAHKRRARGPGTIWVGTSLLHLNKGDLLDDFFRRKIRKYDLFCESAPSFSKVRRVFFGGKKGGGSLSLGE